MSDREFTYVEAAAYLAAMIDGEGHVSIRRKGDKRPTTDRVVRISNCDLDIIAAIERCLDILGITSGKRIQSSTIDHKHHQICYEVTIYRRQSFQILYDDVPIQATRKREALRQILDSYSYPVRPSKEDIRAKYEDEGMTIKELGATFGVATITAYGWLVKHDIPRRPAYPRPRDQRRAVLTNS